jgi:eukaryotic-like serine/threonine-protein kinase
MDQPNDLAGKNPPGPDDGTVVQGLPDLDQTKGLSSCEVDLGDSDCTEPATPDAHRRSRALTRPRPQALGYEIIRPLGAGAFGEVWLAREEDTGIQVAIKFFAHGADAQWKQLQEEVRQLGSLDSVKGIVQLKKVCADAKPPYYVMAYAEKGSLAERLEKGPLKLAEAMNLFRQVTAALDYVHTKGVRHCDLKPANILLDARGRALIADFGQAHLSNDASPVLGTFFYMAPEQADLSGQIPDTRWDVYGLGALLYAMLIGRPPRDNPELREQMKATAELSHRLRRYREWIPQAPPPRAHRRVRGVDRPLAQIIERCLEVDPQRRLPNAGAVLAALNLRERRRRRRPLLLFGLAAPLLLLAVMAGADFSTNKATIHEAEAKLTEQLLDSDRNSARLIANAVQMNITGHFNLLRGSANEQSGLYEAAVAEDQKALEGILTELMKRSVGLQYEFSQATVTNRKGRIMAIVDVKKGEVQPPRDPSTVHFPQYSWRDWFSGEGDQWNEAGRPDALLHPPIAEPHVSDPYVSTGNPDLFVSLSLPIRNPDPAEPQDVVGVLEAAVKTNDINQWLLSVKMEGGFAVLLDKRHFCVLHQDEKAIQPVYGKTAPQFVFAELERQIENDRAAGRRKGETAEAVSGTIAEYHDPVDKGTYLAGYAQMSDDRFGWVALVQHDRAAVLKPIDDLRWKVWSAGWRMLGLAGLLTLFLWGWLFWTLRRTER